MHTISSQTDVATSWNRLLLETWPIDQTHFVFFGGHVEVITGL